MKHSIIIFFTVITSIGLTSLAYAKWKNVICNLSLVPHCSSVISNPCTSSDAPDFDFVYSIDRRFGSGITKENLEGARSVNDLLKVKNIESIESYFNIELSTYNEDRNNEIKIKGDDEVLNEAQIQLLRSMDYATNFYITGNVYRKDGMNDRLIVDTLVNYLSVVPYKPAAYKDGNDALINYLKENSKEEIGIAQKDKVQPGKISFTISKDGTVSKFRLSATSGYKSIDEKMLEIINNIPGDWNVASNAKGEKVDQELVFFFGLIGC